MGCGPFVDYLLVLAKSCLGLHDTHHIELLTVVLAREQVANPGGGGILESAIKRLLARSVLR